MATSITSSQKSVWGFSPQSIPGLQLWLDAADTTSITGTSAVSAWRNKGAAGGSASTTNGTIGSSGSINGRAALSIGSLARMTMPSLTFAQTSRTVFVVATLGNSGSFYLFLDGSTNNIDTVFFIYNGDNRLYFGSIGNAVALQAAFPGGSFNAPSIISGVSAPATNRGIYVNGTAQGLTADTGGTYTTGTTTTQVTGNSTYEVAYTLGELMLFDGALTTQQQQQVEGYLAAKWGLGMNLPTTHPYSSVIPILPTQIPGLQLWLDAADTSTITGTPTVTEWRDKSGNGYHMNTLQPNGAYTSVYPVIGTTINGLNTVFFSAYAGLTQAVTLSGVKNFYWVGRISRSGTSIGSCYNMLGHNSFYDWHGGNYGTGLYLNSFAENGIENATPVSIYGGNTAVVNTTFKLLQLPTDGTVNIISAAGITEDATTRYQGICYDRDNQQTGWVGDVAEAIVFNRALTTAQHQQVEGAGQQLAPGQRQGKHEPPGIGGHHELR